MRKLMWFGIGFGAACVVGAYVFSGVALLAVGFFVLMMALGGLLLFKEVSGKRTASIAALGLALGMLWFECYSMFAVYPFRAYDAEYKQISVTATDYSYETEYGVAVDGSLRIDGKTCKVKMYLESREPVHPGDVISGDFLLRYTGAGGQKESEYHSSSGLRLLCYEKGEVFVEAGDRDAIRYWPARMRRQIVRLVEDAFPEDTQSFAKAILLGDTSDISYKLNSVLTVSGIVHVVSVSGLHVSIIFTVLFAILGRRRIVTPVVGGVLLFFVAAVTGFSPTIVRACLMNALVLLSLMTNREYDSPTALAFAVVVILGVNPLSVTSVGLQLSVVSVMGILMFSGPIFGWIRDRNFWAEAEFGTVRARLRGWIAGSVSVSLGASLLTAPLTALHFGTVSLAGIITNLLTMTVLNFVFCGVIVIAVLASFWMTGARALAWCLSWGIRAVVWVAGVIAQIPFSAVYTESAYIVIWLVLCYILLTVFLLSKKKQVWTLCICVLLILAVAIGASYVEPSLENYRITVIDVGQGQCVLLQSEGRTYMVDCGGDGDKAAADKAVTTLHAQGIFSLDGLIITHYDRDHAGGVQYLLQRVPVKTVYLPICLDAPDMESQILSQTNGQTVRVTEDILLEWDGAVLQIFASEYAQTANETSLCVLFQKENYDILITGDRSVLAEADLVRSGRVPKLDALVAGHHGANTSTSEWLLEATDVETVLISVGKNNPYGHPADSVLERLKTFGCTVRRTDLEGTIIIRG